MAAHDDGKDTRSAADPAPYLVLQSAVSQETFVELQNHLIEFTERLHAAEVEKRDLRHNEAALKREVEKLNSFKCRFKLVDECAQLDGRCAGFVWFNQ